MNKECRLEGCSNVLSPEDFNYSEGFTYCWDHQFLDPKFMVIYYMNNSRYYGD